MAQLLNIFGFLSVLLRALTLSCLSLAVGGIVFALICLSPSDTGAWASCRRLIRYASAGLAIAQLLFVLADSAILRATADLSWPEIITAGFFLAGVAAISAASFCIAFATELKPRRWIALVPAAVMLGSALMTSHAAARIEGQVPALLLTGLHQTATAVWIGGLPFLLLTIARSDMGSAQWAGHRFSRLAQISVATLLLSGIGLGTLYIASFGGLYGTSYGIMVLGKATLLAVVLALGGLNLLLVRALSQKPGTLLARLRRLSEAEIGIGFTAVLAAASLTSQPPAIDLPEGGVTAREIVNRYTPRAPRLQSPQWSELSAPTYAVEDAAKAPTSFVPGAVVRPSSPGDIAWSEYNHNWSGIVVLAMGVLAVASRVFRARWARHWPLAFIGLSLFLFLRADPEAWPLGPKSFWGSMIDPEVLQHRLFATMIVAFAAFEWSVQVGRLQSKAAALVFPMVCAFGGALLLTHSHALGNVKEEYLAELSHLPIAVCAVVAGWTRWLEQRLDSAWRRIPSMIWPVCFVLIGLMLLFYREA